MSARIPRRTSRSALGFRHRPQAGISPTCRMGGSSPRRSRAGGAIIALRRGGSPRCLNVLTVAAIGPRRHRPTWGADAALRTARTCYDHLAGRLGVALTEALVAHGHLLLSDDGGELTAAGAEFLSEFGIDLPTARRRKRIFCRPCLDWSERRSHLAGSVGAALAARCRALGWIGPMRGSRALRITPAGQQGLMDQFGIMV
jgi:hypothetical protein